MSAFEIDRMITLRGQTDSEFAGEFVHKHRDNSFTPFGKEIKVRILGIRSFCVATEYDEDGPDSVTYLSDHPDYEEKLAEVVNGGHIKGFFGAQMAVLLDGEKYIMPLITNGAKGFINFFSQNIDRSIVLRSVYMTGGKHEWFGFEVWQQVTRSSYIVGERICE